MILIGRDFWRPLIDFLYGQLEPSGVIDAADADRIMVTDSVADAVSAVHDIAMLRFGLHYRRPRRLWFLRERS